MQYPITDNTADNTLIKETFYKNKNAEVVVVSYFRHPGHKSLKEWQT
jgi:hypothetical protein